MTQLLLRNVYLRTMRDHRRALVGFGLGIALLVLVTGAFYPTIRDQAEDFQQLAQNLPPSMAAFVGDLSDLTSAPGYLRGRLFGLMLPILFLVYAITKGSDVIGGEEDRGTLDVLLAQPVSRRAVYLEKAAGLASGIGILSALVLAGVILINVAFQMEVPPTDILAATLQLALLGAVHGALALGLTGLGLRRGGAGAATGAVAFGGYLLNAFANLTDVLKPFQPLSPFSHYAEPDPITTGFDPVSAVVLAALAVVPAAVGFVRFQRRDVAV